jgi:hypothetical protein
VLKTLLGRVEFPFGVAGSEFLAPSVTYTNG